VKTAAQIVDDELRENTEGLFAALDVLHPDVAGKITRAMESIAKAGAAAVINALPSVDRIEELEAQAEARREADTMQDVFDARDDLDDFAGQVRRVIEGAPA
jgi:hypothetical protein